MFITMALAVLVALSLFCRWFPARVRPSGRISRGPQSQAGLWASLFVISRIPIYSRNYGAADTTGSHSPIRRRRNLPIWRMGIRRRLNVAV